MSTWKYCTLWFILDGLCSLGSLGMEPSRRMYFHIVLTWLHARVIVLCSSVLRTYVLLWEMHTLSVDAMVQKRFIAALTFRFNHSAKRTGCVKHKDCPVNALRITMYNGSWPRWAVGLINVHTSTEFHIWELSSTSFEFLNIFHFLSAKISSSSRRYWERYFFEGWNLFGLLGGDAYVFMSSEVAQRTISMCRTPLQKLRIVRCCEVHCSTCYRLVAKSVRSYVVFEAAS